MSCFTAFHSPLAFSVRTPSSKPVLGQFSVSTCALGFHGHLNNPVSLRFSIDSSRTVLSSRRISSTRCLCSVSPELKTTLDKVVQSHKVILFMKGTKDFPQCGFSNTVVQILKTCDVPFETVDILENEMLRQGLKEYSMWPTFPQLYIDGEFFGGCDITVEAYKSGELQELLEKVQCS